jgi:D-cysteine desulfhydrase family pyridoxal phosphate-dependent enzyme
MAIDHLIDQFLPRSVLHFRPMENLGLAQLPTPLEEAPRLSEALSAHILIKRDDLTGLALGGNKARKLEHLVRDAIAKGCDTLVTGGGAQSNHARMTAAAAAKMKMACHLVLGGDRPPHLSGNLVLDELFGAELHFTGTDDWSAWQSEIRRLAEEIGPTAYAIPIGGSTPVGALGYVHAADELMAQLPQPPDWIVVATSSGGTQAGLLVGLPASVRVLGIDVARPDPPIAETVRRLASRTAELSGRPLPRFELHVADHTGPHYAALTDECRDAVRLAARTEGLILDPVYTGKALAGLIAAVRERRIGGTIVFWHTGGAPALFADDFAGFI